MNTDFLFSLPIIVFNKRQEFLRLEIFQSAPQSWQAVQNVFKGIQLCWVNRKGQEEIIENEETYIKALRNSNGQGHFFDTDYDFNPLVKLDQSLDPLPKYHLFCLRCEYKNPIFFIKCVNCSNSNRNQLVYKPGGYPLKESW